MIKHKLVLPQMCDKNSKIMTSLSNNILFRSLPQCNIIIIIIIFQYWYNNEIR